ncbi:hypothetical protein D3C86_1483010 [compost metagenome]
MPAIPASSATVQFARILACMADNARASPGKRIPFTSPAGIASLPAFGRRSTSTSRTSSMRRMISSLPASSRTHSSDSNSIRRASRDAPPSPAGTWIRSGISDSRSAALTRSNMKLPPSATKSGSPSCSPCRTARPCGSTGIQSTSGSLQSEKAGVEGKSRKSPPDSRRGSRPSIITQAAPARTTAKPGAS